MDTKDPLDNMLIVSSQISDNMQKKDGRLCYDKELYCAIQALRPKDQLSVEKLLNTVAETMTVEDRKQYFDCWNEHRKLCMEIEFDINGYQIHHFDHLVRAAEFLIKWTNGYDYISLTQRGQEYTYSVSNNGDLIAYSIGKLGTIYCAIVRERLTKIVVNKNSIYYGDIIAINREIIESVWNKLGLEPCDNYVLFRQEREFNRLFGPKLEVAKLNITVCMKIIEFMSEKKFSLYRYGSYLTIKITK
jgi:hypothetical protein